MAHDNAEFRSFLQKKLTENVMKIVFNKADETRREMFCTLNSNMLPARADNAVLETNSERTVNEDIIHVWDIEKKAWRSFRVDSVISYDVEGVQVE